MESDILDITREKMEKSVAALKREMASIRAGRANPQLVERIMVDYYGTPTPIDQLGNVSAPEARLLQITVWDAGVLPEVEKAIQQSDLGINPANDGKIIRLAFPELTEERRREYVKLAHKKGEESKVTIRSARRDGNNDLDKEKKNNEMTEDDVKSYSKRIQDMTDEYIKKIDNMISDKEKEIMEV